MWSKLGIGPGYMAHHILERDPVITYEGLDFSDVLHQRRPQETLCDLMSRVPLTEADLMAPCVGPPRISKRPQAIISI